MKAIIIEGPDGSGKTVLAGQLMEHFGIEYRRPPSTVLSSGEGVVNADALQEWWTHQLTGKLEDAIYDRTTFISAPIYGLIMPQRAQPNAEFLAVGIIQLMDAGVKVVFCRPPLSKQLEAVGEQHRDNLEGLRPETYEKIDMAYYTTYTLWKEAHFSETYLYDYTTEDWTDLAKQLEG